MSNLSQFSCHVCSARKLEEVVGFEKLRRVTSDCKPFAKGGLLAFCTNCGAVQKPPTDRWRAEAAAIYRNYDIYFQSNGVEQSVFDPARGVPELRSEVLLKNLDRVRPLGATGKVIDVGCGKGTFLSAFQKFRPGWRLFGHELDSSNEYILATIPGFEKLFVGPSADLPGDFDLITLVHALEHFEEPMEGVRDLAKKLAPDGILAVEVPNAGASPFDLVIADHASHFTPDDLWRLSGAAGIGPLVVADNWMAKELSLVAVRREGVGDARPPADVATVRQQVFTKMRWLGAVLEQARAAANSASKFGIFGTSIASMWLYGELSDKVAFFVDEDPSRAGELHGRPVFTPDLAPDGATIYLALLPHIAEAVGSRIQRNTVKLVIPPDAV